MKKTIQRKQTYLFGWNRLEIILVPVLFSGTDICICNALPATCFSPVSSRISTQAAATTNYREMQTLTPCHWEARFLSSSTVTCLGEIGVEVRNYHEPRGSGSLPLSPAPCTVSHWNAISFPINVISSLQILMVTGRTNPPFFLSMLLRKKFWNCPQNVAGRGWCHLLVDKHTHYEGTMVLWLE